MTNDIQTIQDFGFETLELMISQVLNVIGAAVTLTLYHPSFLVSLLLLTALMGIIPKLFSVKLAEKTNDFSAKNEALTKTITVVLNGYDILKNAGKNNHISKKIEKASLLVKMSKITYARLFGTMMASQNATSFFSQLTVLTQAGLLFYWHLIPIQLV
ncbi:ABC transporter transmembrane domain-containing protein [Streptococcus pluranimalium]|uniref:ABC transporter transmembrane domain-containing protein n=1 Tax=Streptococcus pluranimalium TaxID=82348 RepID=UPI003F67D674